MFIPGFLINLATFPGVIVHEIAHQLFCDLAKVPVKKVVYYQVASPYGYVEHDETPDLKSSFLITVGPFLVATFLCAVLTFPLTGMLSLKDYGATVSSWVPPTCFWLGISIGMHAFPGQAELDRFRKQIDTKGGFVPLYLLSSAVRMFFVLARFGRFFWFDAIYAGLVALIAPMVLCWSFL